MARPPPVSTCKISHAQDDAKKRAVRELCFKALHKTITTRYKLMGLTKLIAQGHTAQQLAGEMIALANVPRGQLMLTLPTGRTKPNSWEHLQVYNQLYRQVLPEIWLAPFIVVVSLHTNTHAYTPHRRGLRTYGFLLC